MSRGYGYLLLLDRAGQVGDQWNTRKNKAGRVLRLFRGFYVVAPHSCRLRIASFWPQWQVLSCVLTACQVFMGPDKPSSFCNYFIEPHLPASCGAFTFGGRMRPMAKTLSLKQGPDFDLVGTCEWLSYVRAFGSQAYSMLVRFFPCRVYIDSSHRDTLGYEWHLTVVVIS
jgi:hypothetical protein